MKGKSRTKLLHSKNARKEAAFKDQTKTKLKLSKYGKKAAYLAKHGLWGFQVRDKSVWGGPKG